MGQPALHRLYPHMSPQPQKHFIIEGHLISNVYTARSLSFAIVWLQLWWVPPHEILDGWIILALVVVLNMLRDMSITIDPIWVYPFFKFARKANIKGIYVTRVSTVQVQPWKYVFPIPKNILVCQICTFNKIFLIFYLSLEIDNFPMIIIWLVFRVFPYPTIHVRFSI